MTETDNDMGPGLDRTLSASHRPQAEADADQLLYAGILAKGMYLGLGILLVTFTLYLTGILQPGIPIEELPRLWTLSVHEYLEAVNQEFLHRPGGHYPAFVGNQHTLADLGGVVEVLTRNNPCAGEFADDLRQGACAARIKAGPGLIESQYLRSAGQDRRDGRALLLPAGQMMRAP